MNVHPYLQKMVEVQASDLFFTSGVAPSVKVNGEIYAVGKNVLSEHDAQSAVFNLMNEDQKAEFIRSHECNFALDAKNVGRFRISAFIQRNHVGCVIRHIKSYIPTIQELKLPPVIKDLSALRKGLIIIIGSTGSGKSTTLAAMVQERNMTTKGHILTIEDPIEYIHQHQKSIITQREVGMDTENYEVALKNAMRQAPDVIVIGEIRDMSTMRYAIAFAETGHLCIATLHASSCDQALDRIVHFYPEAYREQLWLDLSMNLRAIVGQRLIRTKNCKERIAAIEIMINSPIVSDCIRKGDIHQIREYIERSAEIGMQTFDQALYALIVQDMITEEDALLHSDSANNLRLMIKRKDRPQIGMMPADLSILQGEKVQLEIRKDN